MNSRAEIARAWDLFHLGSFQAEADFCCRFAIQRLPSTPLDGNSPRRQEEKRRLGAWLAQNGGEKLAPVGRAHENIALSALRCRSKIGFPRHRDGLSRSRVCSSARCIHGRDACSRARRTRARVTTQNASSAFVTRHFAHGSTGSTSSLKSRATYLLHALSLASMEPWIAVCPHMVAGTLAVLIREVELGELGSCRNAAGSRHLASRTHDASRFYTQRAIAWRKALRGDWIPAMHLLDGLVARARCCTPRNHIHRSFAYQRRRWRIGRGWASRQTLSIASGDRLDRE